MVLDVRFGVQGLRGLLHETLGSLMALGTYLPKGSNGVTMRLLRRIHHCTLGTLKVAFG